MCIARAERVAGGRGTPRTRPSRAPSPSPPPWLRAHLDCTSGAVHACPPADAVLFLPLCTRWHCQLSYGEWAPAAAGTLSPLPAPGASLWVVLGEERGAICTDLSSSAGLLMVICDVYFFFLSLLQCPTRAGSRALVPGRAQSCWHSRRD